MNTWNSVAFGDLYMMPSRNGLTRPSNVRGSGYKMVNMGELFEYPMLRNPDMERVNLREDEKKTYSLCPGDLLFARQSLVLEGAGKCSIVIDCEENTVFESHLIRVRLDPGKSDPLFYHYYLRSELGMGTVQTIVRQVAAAGIRGSDLERLKVLCPPLPIQRRIAAILSAYDDSIENNTRRIALLEKMAEEVYREWFVRLRFPGHESVPVHQGGPEGWHRVPIRTFCDEVRSSIKAKDLTADMRYIGLEHIPRKSMFLMDWDSAGNVDSDKLRFVEGDILFGKIRPYLHKVSMTHFSGVCSSDAIVVRAKNPNARGYLFFTLFSDAFVDLAATACKGSQMPRADWDFLKKVEILSPPKPILEAYGRLFEANFRLMEQIALTNEKLLQSRKILLPRLLSGKLDVGYLDIPFPPEIDEPMTATRKQTTKEGTYVTT